MAGAQEAAASVVFDAIRAREETARHMADVRSRAQQKRVSGLIDRFRLHGLRMADASAASRARYRSRPRFLLLSRL